MKTSFLAATVALASLSLVSALPTDRRQASASSVTVSVKRTNDPSDDSLGTTSVAVNGKPQQIGLFGVQIDFSGASAQQVQCVATDANGQTTNFGTSLTPLNNAGKGVIVQTVQCTAAASSSSGRGSNSGSSSSSSGASSSGSQSGTVNIQVDTSNNGESAVQIPVTLGQTVQANGRDNLAIDAFIQGVSAGVDMSHVSCSAVVNGISVTLPKSQTNNQFGGQPQPVSSYECH